MWTQCGRDTHETGTKEGGGAKMTLPTVGRSKGSDHSNQVRPPDPLRSITFLLTTGDRTQTMARSAASGDADSRFRPNVGWGTRSRNLYRVTRANRTGGS